MVVVSISETYDLHTVVDKMTLIGIHTPKKELIQKTYPGLCMNFRYFRILKQDVVLSTAQTLPLSVDEIGLDSGQIHPQDMMNPILYKACSNDSWSTLEARLMGLCFGSATNAVTPPIEGSMATAENDFVTGLADEHGVYYSLLSNREGFKVAPPQNGLEMRGLVPLVFEQWYNFGENSALQSTAVPQPDGIQEIRPAGAESSQLVKSRLTPRAMRGRPHPMPKINTTYLTGTDPHATSSTPVQGTDFQLNGMGDGIPRNYQIQMPDIPPVMLAAILLPPVTATTGILYYRMVTRCYIEFTDPRPMTEITSFFDMDFTSGQVYHSDYSEQSRIMDQTTDMVDVKNASIQKIMEGR